MSTRHHGCLVLIQVGFAWGCAPPERVPGEPETFSDVTASGPAAQVDRSAERPGLDRLMAAFPGAMMKLNQAPLPSLAAPGSNIDLWVTASAQPLYSQISPERQGSGVELPVGTTIVRSIRDSSDRLKKYTVLVKRESGFNPPADLWFGVYDAQGMPTGDVSEDGKAPSCTACHLSRGSDGFVFGPPAATQPTIPGNPPTGPAPVDDAAVTERLLRLFAGPMVKVNDGPLPSLAVPDATIDLWVSESARDLYSRLNPDREGSGVQLPVGAVVVRAIRDGGGQVQRYTALARREAGFHPPSDLWFGVFDAHGQATEDPREHGKGEACVSCHLQRAQDGFLFGPPQAGR